MPTESAKSSAPRRHGDEPRRRLGDLARAKVGIRSLHQCDQVGVDADARKDLGRVLTEPGRRPAQGTRGRRQARDHVVHGDAADLLVGHIDHDLPGLHVRIGDELVDVVDRRRRVLDLDNLGAEVSELQREHVARHQTREIEHGDAVEGQATSGRNGSIGSPQLCWQSATS